MCSCRGGKIRVAFIDEHSNPMDMYSTAEGVFSFLFRLMCVLGKLIDRVPRVMGVYVVQILSLCLYSIYKGISCVYNHR
jgi:hypothetical protein